MINDMKNSRELAWRLFVRDFFARYRRSVLGIFWSFLPPILTGLVFIVLQKKGVVHLGPTEIPYPVYVLVGTILWQLFTESLNAPLNTVRASISMLGKVNFPREALIVSAFYQVLVNLLIKSLVLAGTFIYFGISLSAGILIAPVAILVLILLGMTIGLILTPLGMLFTDVGSSLAILTQVWFFLTPVVYPAPKTFPYSLIATLNPVSPVLMAARDLMTRGTMDDPLLFAVVSGLTLVGLLFAWVMYRLAMPIIIERMSA
jgi:lipopolysaccharide transport system permease protein